MRFLKSKAQKALVTAVTMSLVMGVCGSAMAAEKAFGGKNGQWVIGTDYPFNIPNTVDSGFKGEWKSGEASSLYGGVLQDSGDPITLNTVTISGGKTDYVFGGFGSRKDKASIISYNTITIEEGSNVTQVFGGDANKTDIGSDDGSFNNIVNISGGNVKDVYGGRGTNEIKANGNIVNISGGSGFVNVFGGIGLNAGLVAEAKDNTVNLIGNGGKLEVVTGYDTDRKQIKKLVANAGTDINIKESVVGGRGKTSEGNTLNVAGKNTSVKGTSNFQNMNFYLPKSDEDGTKMLIATYNVDLTDVVSFNTITSVEGNDAVGYKPGATINLVSSGNDRNDYTKISTDIFKIDGEKALEKTISVVGLNEGIQASMGYEIKPREINFITMYKLIDDTNVAENNIKLGGRLDLNDKTLDMQQDEKETAQYNTVTVKKLIGTGNLAIDVDLDGGKNDMIEITGEETNEATINLNSIIVRTELDGEDRTENNKVTVIDGNAAGVALNLTNLSVKTATTDYIYTFTKGAAGKLNVTKESTASIVDFIQGNKKYAEIYTYALNKDETAKGNLDATKRKGDNKVLNLEFNKDISLSGNNEFKGVTVADGYTLKLNGVDGAPGKVTGFKDAASTVEKNGTLDVANIKFASNDKDIVNNGTLNLDGVNAINDISGTGAMFVNAGTTEISKDLTQGQINIKNNGKLVVTGTTNIKGLNMDKEAAFEQKDGNFVLDGSFTNAADVTLTNLGGSDGYEDLATAKNKITGQLTNNGQLTLDNTFLTVRYFEGNEVKIKNGGKLFVPENVFDGEATVDMDGSRQAKSPNEDVIDSMSSAVSFGRIEINDIRKRMGDVRQIKDTKGIWARSENGKLEGMGVDAKFHKFQIGSDNAVSDKWRVGGAVSYTNSNAHYNRGSNSIKNYSGAAYGMYTGKDGEFVDVIARVGMNKTSLNFTAGDKNQKGDLDRVAFALSTEVGKTFAMKNNFYIEPQVELTYSYSGSDDFNSNGYKYDMDSSDSFIGRLGFTLGYKNANRGGVYTRLSWLREFSGDNKLTVSDGVITKSYSNDGKESWGEWAIGGQIQASKATYIYADAEKTFGANVNEKYRVNVGLRYSF